MTQVTITGNCLCNSPLLFLFIFTPCSVSSPVSCAAQGICLFPSALAVMLIQLHSGSFEHKATKKHFKLFAYKIRSLPFGFLKAVQGQMSCGPKESVVLEGQRWRSAQPKSNHTVLTNQHENTWKAKAIPVSA